MQNFSLFSQIFGCALKIKSSGDAISHFKLNLILNAENFVVKHQTLITNISSLIEFVKQKRKKKFNEKYQEQLF